MRRGVAAAVLGLALFAAGACGDDGEDPAPVDDGTVEEEEQQGDQGPDGEVDEARAEACRAVDAAFARLESEEGQAVSQALFEAEDPEALAEAETEYLQFAGGVVQELSAVGEETDDPELSSALEVLADEFESLSADVAADPAGAEQLDMTSFQTALQDVGLLCQPAPAPTG